MPSTRSSRGFLGDLFLSRETWLSVVLLCWEVLLGVVIVLVVYSGMALAAGLLGAALFPSELTVLRLGWRTISVDTHTAALVVGATGIGATWAVLALVNVLGHVARWIAVAIIGPD